ncbi:histidine kinase [Chitinophaga sp.]|uniref:sensor histidine kinase n=1 Tax=Chitinophaga sp. TaxID=1869181 RepID=UPI0031E0A8E7
MKYTYHFILVIVVIGLTICVPYMTRPATTFTVNELYYSVMLENAMAAGGYFLNFYVFIPFLYNRTRVLYFITLLAYFAGMLYIPIELNHLFAEFRFLVIFLPVPQLMKLSMTFMLSYIARRRYEWNALAEEKTAFELAALKQQMQPHFFFNTLNGIYGLSIKESPETPAYILKLASMMRYVLYESNGDKVSLAKEIEHLTNYCQMQQLRLGTNNKVKLSVTGNITTQQIAPFILIPFIENNFKHGISASIETTMDISIHVTPDVLQFTSANTIVSCAKHEGVGIKNVKRRLELIYPGLHTLVIHQQAQQFIVQLSVSL